MILVDSSVWIDFFNGVESAQVGILDASLGEVPIIVGDLIMTEVLQGFRSTRDFNAARTALDQFEYRDMVGRDIALQSAGNYRLLRRQGITVRKTIDVIIATYCVENSIALLHADRDFDPMEKILGLSVVAG
ncbi:PIN domain nuclease [Hyphomonas sp.]|uniref:type II toxin-antitoxin system VapC family toxin n=1 Tax=Hyphomonas sp. TaxID=87 RepID=UPI0025BA293D|nr:PIN domain nuclease [Hyphomonas sp.]MBI1400846.1 PIN domain-containing protein [Hyphomonas sp.]